MKHKFLGIFFQTLRKRQEQQLFFVSKSIKNSLSRYENDMSFSTVMFNELEAKNRYRLKDAIDEYVPENVNPVT